MEFLKKSLNKVNVQENTLYDIIYDLKNAHLLC